MTTSKKPWYYDIEEVGEIIAIDPTAAFGIKSLKIGMRGFVLSDPVDDHQHGTVWSAELLKIDIIENCLEVRFICANGRSIIATKEVMKSLGYPIKIPINAFSPKPRNAQAYVPYGLLNQIEIEK